MRKVLPKFDGGSYAHFVTTRTHRSRRYFRDEGLCQIIVEELGFYSERLGFALVGYVIMPDHVHLLLWWDSDEKPGLRVSDIVRRIKTMVSKRAKRYMFYDGGVEYLDSLGDVAQATHCGGESESPDSTADIGPPTRPAWARERGDVAGDNPKRFRLWQPGFYDFNVCTEEKLLEKLRYMHENPVKAGLVDSPGDYAWSSWCEYFDGKMSAPALGIEGGLCPG